MHDISDKLQQLFPSASKRDMESENPSEVDSYLMQIFKEVAKRYTMRLQTYAKVYNRVIVNKGRASVRLE